MSSPSKVGGGGSLRGALVALGVLTAAAGGGVLGVAVLVGGAAGAVASVAIT